MVPGMPRKPATNPETLAGLSAKRLDIYAYCNKCGHSAVVKTKTLLAKLGPLTAVPMVSRHLVCQACGSKDVGTPPSWPDKIGMAHRGILFGVGLAWVAVVAIFLFDLLAVRHGWCGHLCPLGAFYGLLGRAAQLRVAFDASTCTHCGDCIAVCPEPWVLDLEQAARTGMIASGDCTNCGRCTPICPEGSLGFDLRFRITARRTT